VSQVLSFEHNEDSPSRINLKKHDLSPIEEQNDETTLGNLTLNQRKFGRADGPKSSIPAKPEAEDASAAF